VLQLQFNFNGKSPPGQYSYSGLSVNIPPVASREYKDNAGLVLQAADYAVVSYAITPQSLFVSSEGPPELSWVFAAFDSGGQIVQNLFLGHLVQALQVF